jgi:hypothetical protein
MSTKHDLTCPICQHLTALINAEFNSRVVTYRTVSVTFNQAIFGLRKYRYNVKVLNPRVVLNPNRNPNSVTLTLTL